MTTPLSLGQRTRHAKTISLTSPALASKAHSSTPRRSRKLVAAGGVVDVLILADGQLILDRDPDREIMAIANNGLERAFVGLRCRQDQAGRSFVAFDDGAFDLDLVIGAETEPHRFVLAGGSHVTATDEHAVTIDRNPARQQRRVLALCEARFEKRGWIDHRDRPYGKIGRNARGGDAQALGALARANADAAWNHEHHLETADFRRGLLLVGLFSFRGLIERLGHRA